VLLAACGGGDSGDMSGPAAPEMYGPPGMQNAAEHRVAASGPAIKRIDSRLRSAHGQVSVWVSLDQASVAAAQAAGATAARLDSATMSTDAAVTSTMKRAAADQRASIQSAQSALASNLAALGAAELARVHVAHNAIAVRVDASQLSLIAALPGVAQVR